MKGDNPIILFDGYCKLCNHTVQFVIRNDPQKQFKLAALQSDAGQLLIKQNGLESAGNNTFILIQSNKTYTRSTAALLVCKQLSGAWKILYGFIIVPRFLRDAVYNFVAKNRYRFFGKKDECMMPTQDLLDRFLQ
jgi:predicted DCC family thiol-disulfide oxidoreductase YuxK